MVDRSRKLSRNRFIMLSMIMEYNPALESPFFDLWKAVQASWALVHLLSARRLRYCS
jgi:hypothetical protein